jgi:ribosomal protein S18 acetylase RimI-like enzyme
MNIRAYREDDEAAVAALWRRAFAYTPPWNVPEEDIARKLAVQPEVFFVAESGGQIVGTAMAGYDGHRGWVYYVAVSPSHRRQGIGTALMRHAEQALSAMGCPKLNLQVRAGDHGAVAFYRRLGYDVEERVSMSKRLTGPSPGCDEQDGLDV